MRKIRRMKFQVETYEEIETMKDDLGVLMEFHETGESSEEEIYEAHDKLKAKVEDLEFRSMLPAEEDVMSAVLQITSGAGGTESCDWASMLLRMYMMWAGKKGFKVTELNYQEGDVAGVKTVTIEINGDYAFGYLKGENGVHRLVRISPFDSNARGVTLPSLPSMCTRWPMIPSGSRLIRLTSNGILSEAEGPVARM